MEKQESLEEYYARYRKALDQQTLDTFFAGNAFTDVDMRNLVNGLDLLYEITATTYFKSNRFLETPDTYRRADVHRLYNLRKVNGVSPNKIKKVSYPTNEMIAEFFNDHYIGLFYRMMHHVKDNKITFKMPFEQECYIRFDPVFIHGAYSCIEFVNVKKKEVLKLPFFLSRLGAEHVAVRTGS